MAGANADGENAGAVMEIADLRQAIDWQARHAEEAGGPRTARVIRAEKAILDTQTGIAARMNGWQGLSLEDALPLRVVGGLHHLFLSGQDRSLEPVYAGLTTDQATIDGLVARMAERYDARLMPWLDKPPQTNEAGRSAAIMAGLLWLAERLRPKFEINEFGASAGINTMMGRYHYNLGGVQVGPGLSRMKIAPEWRGDPPPETGIEIVEARGCDIAPIDLTDPEQALRLKAYVWADAADRMARIDAAIGLAERAAPEIARMDAGDFVAERLAAPQEEGVTRVLFHTVMWQYLPQATRDAITEAMGQAGAAATDDRPLACIGLETNRATLRHELRVRYWPGGEEPVLLAEAHPQGAWVEWFGATKR